MLLSFCTACVAQQPATSDVGSSESGGASDWPNWRGPSHNGISVERDWLASWDENAPKTAWKTNVGIGFSSVSVADGRLYTMGHEKGKKKDKVGDDTVWCFDAKTGKEIWTHTYKCKIVDNLHEGFRCRIRQGLMGGRPERTPRREDADLGFLVLTACAWRCPDRRSRAHRFTQ